MSSFAFGFTMTTPYEQVTGALGSARRTTKKLDLTDCFDSAVGSFIGSEPRSRPHHDLEVMRYMKTHGYPIVTREQVVAARERLGIKSSFYRLSE